LNYGDIMLVKDEEAIRINDRKFTKTNPPTSSTYPDDWNNLIGEYGDDHIVLYFYEKASHLFTLIEWMEKDKLTQLSENEFAFPESGGMYHGEKFIFERDTNGKAIRVSIENGPVFNRRKLGSASETFRIEPVLPIEELRTMALAANPPSENGNFKESNLVELKSLDLSIEYDIRYASTNNFMSNKFYSLPRAYLQAPAAEALVRVHQKLKELGYGLLIHDAYRPWYVTKMFWDATPEDKKIFVADPSDGSRHNRGAAVDLTLFDLKTGKVIEMVAGYDEMTDRSFPFYFGGNTAQRHHRTLLRIAMEEEGFEVYEYEWWHFDYTDWENYRIQNIQFSEIK
jgi:D-alanyl-D-alanine dipeptidase